ERSLISRPVVATTDRQEVIGRPKRRCEGSTADQSEQRFHGEQTGTLQGHVQHAISLTAEIAVMDQASHWSIRSLFAWDQRASRAGEPRITRRCLQPQRTKEVVHETHEIHETRWVLLYVSCVSWTPPCVSSLTIIAAQQAT